MVKYTTLQAVHYFKNKPSKNIEFKNVKNENIEIFMLSNGKIGKGEIGDGLVTEFNRNNYMKDLWIMKLNPYL